MRLILRHVLVGLMLATVACRSVPPTSARISHYIVTTAPIDVGVAHSGLCVAVDPADPQGVWWWQPGRSGCSSRSTGPGVFHATEATVVARTESAGIEARFRVPLHGGPGLPNFVEVHLTIQGRNMLAASTGARVTTERRNDLNVPEKPSL